MERKDLVEDKCFLIDWKCQSRNDFFSEMQCSTCRDLGL